MVIWDEKSEYIDEVMMVKKSRNQRIGLDFGKVHQLQVISELVFIEVLESAGEVLVTPMLFRMSWPGESGGWGEVEGLPTIPTIFSYSPLLCCMRSGLDVAWVPNIDFPTNQLISQASRSRWKFPKKTNIENFKVRSRKIRPISSKSSWPVKNIKLNEILRKFHIVTT